MIQLKDPYLLFIGAESDPLAVKTAQGVAHWCPEKCIGEYRMPDCQVTLGLEHVNLQDAVAMGAKTFIIGAANRSGIVAQAWIPIICEALRTGLDVASGLHQHLKDIDIIAETAKTHHRQLFDIRYPAQTFSVATGVFRSGQRLLTVGTDVSVGKMYTALALTKAMQGCGMQVDFCATGQTGILITGSGVPIDAVIADFISGEIEELTPANNINHWDIIEGQGSLFHPSYAGVSLGLLHGAQPTVLVLCHEVNRAHIRGCPHLPLPGIEECLKTYLTAAKLTATAPFFAGLAINTATLTAEAAHELLQEYADKYSLPCVDPLRTGVDAIVA